MAARADDIGDFDASGPPTGIAPWARARRTSSSRSTPSLRRPRCDALSNFRGRIEPVGVVDRRRSARGLIRGAREHFGFADGFSQPAIEGVTDDKHPASGVPKGRQRRGRQLGEFILGYEDEESLADPKRRLPERPRRPARAQRDLHGLAKALPGCRAVSAQTLEASRAVSRAATKEVAGEDRRPLAERHAACYRAGREPNRDFNPKATGANDFRYPDDLEGPAARSARTSAGPIRATRCWIDDWHAHYSGTA